MPRRIEEENSLIFDGTSSEEIKGIGGSEIDFGLETQTGMSIQELVIREEEDPSRRKELINQLSNKEVMVFPQDSGIIPVVLFDAAQEIESRAEVLRGNAVRFKVKEEATRLLLQGKRNGEIVSWPITLPDGLLPCMGKKVYSFCAEVIEEFRDGEGVPDNLRLGEGFHVKLFFGRKAKGKAKIYNPKDSEKWVFTSDEVRVFDPGVEGGWRVTPLEARVIVLIILGEVPKRSISFMGKFLLLNELSRLSFHLHRRIS